MYGYRKSRSVIAALVVGLCAAIFSVSSLAITIDAGPSDYRRWGTGTNTHTLDGLRSSTGQTIRMPPLNTNLNVTRNAVIPYNSLANGMRNFVRITPGSAAASAAVTGLFLAMDWYFDNDKGEWVKESLETAPPDVPTGLWIAGGGWTSGANGLSWSTKEIACQSLIPAYLSDTSASWTYRGVGFANNRWNCYAYRNGQSFPNAMGAVVNSSPSCPLGWDYNVIEGSCTRLGSDSLSASDFNDLAGYLPSASADQVGTAGHDTQRMIGNPLPGYQDQQMTGPDSITGDTTTSTTTDPSTGQSTVTETSTTTNISYGDTTITTTTTTTTTNYNSDGSVSSETVTETTPGQEVISGGGGGVWRPFCEWAVVVCDWLEWTKEGWPEEEPDLPQVVDFTPDGDFQVGGPGSCPAPYVLSIGWLINQAFEVSYQPFCDFALIVNPLFLAFCYLVAGVLTVRSL